nr:XRE family transcriptional regulator [Roseovarius sp.]
MGRRMRRMRHRLSLTLQELGAKSGVSVGYLSQVERGNATPSLGTLSQIATALGVDVDYFIAKPQTADSITRSEHRARFAIAGSSIEYEQIGIASPGHELTSFIMNVPPGYQSEVVTHVGEEIIYVLDGEISQTVGARDYLMTAGDSLHYLGETPHCWSNKTDLPARILWVGKMQYEKSAQVGPQQSQDRDTPDNLVPLRPSLRRE